ncbi:MAG: helix-turn-helix transcriptional regulator [Lachnospiraceae bacterium]|nr:helix-turn-helix transcriptional regulator [Lachnospiraceae bacterium]
MDKEKLGLFVSRLRKEQNMTQKELAERLGVTDKAVSKWERGLSFPDISLLEPLADTFDVSVMELLQGKRMPKEETISVELAQEVLDDSLRISDREIQRKHVISKSIILLCCVSLMLLISIILNIINLSVSPDSGTYTPDLSSEAYETTLTGENEEIFTNPEHALEQITEDVQSFDSEEWNYLIKILSNTYKEVTAE